MWQRATCCYARSTPGTMTSVAARCGSRPGASSPHAATTCAAPPTSSPTRWATHLPHTSHASPMHLPCISHDVSTTTSPNANLILRPTPSLTRSPTRSPTLAAKSHQGASPRPKVLIITPTTHIYIYAVGRVPSLQGRVYAAGPVREGGLERWAECLRRQAAAAGGRRQRRRPR